MTVKLELKPEVEAGLVAQAHARGLSLEAYLDQVLQNAADVFVVKQGNEWDVKRSNAERTSAILPTQAEAIERAKELAGQPAGTTLTRAQIAGQRIRELRKGVTLGGISIKELIEEGRE
jgi:Uncharacterized protein conserved in bacteria (DUF2188)